jgi:osmotically-inducible protein OsmY
LSARWRFSSRRFIVGGMAMTRRTDGDIRAGVADRLRETQGDDAMVGVSVRGGMVTLSGVVASTNDRLAMRQAAMGAAGVRGVADDMVVREPGTPGDADSELLALANRMLAAEAEVPAGAVTAGVRDHVLTLSGTVSVPSQREAAVRAVQHIKGVVGVSNDIQVAGS